VAFLILAIALTVVGSVLVWFFSSHRPVRRTRRSPVSDYQSGLRALSPRRGHPFEPPSAVQLIEPDVPIGER
jgi:hypothetical protein